MSSLELFGFGAFGALIQEVLWWYNGRHSLDHERYEKLTRSLGYWAVTTIFILLAGGLTAVWFLGETPPSARTALLTGAMAPLLLKQALKAASPPQHFGASRFSFRDYLQ